MSRPHSPLTAAPPPAIVGSSSSLFTASNNTMMMKEWGTGKETGGGSPRTQQVVTVTNMEDGMQQQQHQQPSKLMMTEEEEQTPTKNHTEQQQQQQPHTNRARIISTFLQRVTTTNFPTEYERAKRKAEGVPGYSSRLTKQTTNVLYRNRYSNVVTIEETRVKLLGEKNDYINASFVGGKRFIAAQAPLPHTGRDFWIMCLQHRVPCIVMLTPFEEVSGSGGVREKSTQYFPQNVGQVMEDMDLTIHCLSSEVITTGLVARKIIITRRREGEEAAAAIITHVLSHLHFTNWPDFGNLTGDHLNGVLTTLRAMQTIEASNVVTSNDDLCPPPPPPVVHCSAGIGRSGTFIALALILERLSTGQLNEINVVDMVAELRSQRPLMVQTVGQFEMIYDGLVALLGTEHSR